jgi:tRNA(Ile2) C34 agmatinyltransferase TiaS
MSAGLVAEAPLDLFGRAAGAACRGGGRLTLEERLDRVLEAVRAGEPADCPVCRAHMREDGEGAGCASCGSRLS